MANYIRDYLAYLLERGALWLHYKAEAEKEKEEGLQRVFCSDFTRSGNPGQKCGAIHRDPQAASRRIDTRFKDGVEQHVETV